MDLQTMLLKLLRDPQVQEYTLLQVKDIPFSPAVRQMCQSNQCGKYGTCWTCPPGAGTQEELQSKICAYTDAWIFTCTHRLEDSFDLEGMMAGQQKAQKLLRKLMGKLRTAGVDFMALGCEGCGICPRCTYPDGPCRFPELAVPSVEACGIHVVELAKRAALRYNNGPNTVTYFCILLCR